MSPLRSLWPVVPRLLLLPQLLVCGCSLETSESAERSAETKPGVALDLSWTLAEGAATQEVTGYNLYGVIDGQTERSLLGTFEVVDASTRTKTIDEATFPDLAKHAGKNVCFSLTVLGAGGESTPSELSCADIP